MKVDGSKPPEEKDMSNIQKIDKNQAIEKTTPVADGKQKSGAADKVDLSGKAREINRLMELINQLPDIRTDKVEALKKAIETGDYSIDSLKIAEKMILEEM